MLGANDSKALAGWIAAALSHRLSQANVDVTIRKSQLADDAYQVSAYMPYDESERNIHAFANFKKSELVKDGDRTILGREAMIRVRQHLEQGLVKLGAKPTDNPHIEWSDPLPVAEPAAVMPSNPSWGIY